MRQSRRQTDISAHPPFSPFSPGARERQRQKERGIEKQRETDRDKSFSGENIHTHTHTHTYTESDTDLKDRKRWEHMESGCRKNQTRADHRETALLQASSLGGRAQQAPGFEPAGSGCCPRCCHEESRCLGWVGRESV
jgi:hypothetical protein